MSNKRSLHNIEQLPGKAHKTGYGSGTVWHISKTNSSYGNWIARDTIHQLQPVYAFTLQQMSEKIEDAKNRNYAPGGPGPYVLMLLQTDGSIIGYLVSTASGRRAIHATRHGAITFETRAKAEAYNRDEQSGKLTPVRVADLPDPSGPHVLKKNPRPKMPNSEQLDALANYAEKHGRGWKDKLALSWLRGGDHGPLLQQVRNQFGPSWLNKFSASTLTKNPRPFGKRKATHNAFPRKTPRKAAPKFGKRKAAPKKPRVLTVRAMKNPMTPHHVIRGYHRLTGAAYYFNGRGFTDKKMEAAFYTEGKQAEKIMDEIEDRAPKALGPLDVHHFFTVTKREH